MNNFYTLSVKLEHQQVGEHVHLLINLPFGHVSCKVYILMKVSSHISDKLNTDNFTDAFFPAPWNSESVVTSYMS